MGEQAPNDAPFAQGGVTYPRIALHVALEMFPLIAVFNGGILITTSYFLELAGYDTFAGPLLAMGLVFWMAFAISGVGWLVVGHIVVGTLVFTLRGLIVVLMV